MKDHQVHSKLIDMQNSNRKLQICQIDIIKIGTKTIQSKSIKLLKNIEETTDFNHQKHQ